MSNPKFAGARHDWIDQMCACLETEVQAAAANALTGEVPERAALVVLPVWRWTLPGLDIGRKGFSSTGDRFLMPTRITWDRGPVVFVDPDMATELSWSSAGLGTQAHGQMTITPVSGTPQPTTGLPESAEAAVQSRHQLTAALRRLINAGRTARWDGLNLLAKRTDEAVTRANTTVAIELNGPASGPLLDPAELDIVRDKMMMGDDTEKIPSAMRMLNKATTDPTAFHSVDPLRYAVVWLRRDAEQTVRDHIGDPRIGAKIRSLQRRTGLTDLDELIAAYREAHPGDKLALRREGRLPGRLLAALSAPERVRHAQPDRRGLSLRGGADIEAGSVPDIADEIADRIDAERAA